MAGYPFLFIFLIPLFRKKYGKNLKVAYTESGYVTHSYVGDALKKFPCWDPARTKKVLKTNHVPIVGRELWGSKFLHEGKIYKKVVVSECLDPTHTNSDCVIRDIKDSEWSLYHMPRVDTRNNYPPIITGV